MPSDSTPAVSGLPHCPGCTEPAIRSNPRRRAQAASSAVAAAPDSARAAAQRPADDRAAVRGDDVLGERPGGGGVQFPAALVVPLVVQGGPDPDGGAQPVQHDRQLGAAGDGVVGAGALLGLVQHQGVDRGRQQVGAARPAACAPPRTGGARAGRSAPPPPARPAASRAPPAGGRWPGSRGSSRRTGRIRARPPPWRRWCRSGARPATARASAAVKPRSSSALAAAAVLASAARRSATLQEAAHGSAGTHVGVAHQAVGVDAQDLVGGQRAAPRAVHAGQHQGVAHALDHGGQGPAARPVLLGLRRHRARPATRTAAGGQPRHGCRRHCRPPDIAPILPRPVSRLSVRRRFVL